MAWSSEEDKKRAEETRARVLLDGEKLLDMVVAELCARGRLAKPIRGKDRAGKWGGGHEFIELDGVRIPFYFQQAKTPFHGYHGGNPLPYLEVCCNGRYLRDVFRAKTFARSTKTRQDSFGFDLARIADHLELWWKSETESNAKAEIKQSALDQWEAIEALLREEFPGLAEGQIKATAQGLKLELTVNESQARRIFEVLKLKV